MFLPKRRLFSLQYLVEYIATSLANSRFKQKVKILTIVLSIEISENLRSNSRKLIILTNSTGRHVWNVSYCQWYYVHKWWSKLQLLHTMKRCHSHLFSLQCNIFCHYLRFQFSSIGFINLRAVVYCASWMFRKRRLFERIYWRLKMKPTALTVLQRSVCIIDLWWASSIVLVHTIKTVYKMDSLPGACATRSCNHFRSLLLSFYSCFKGRLEPLGRN